MIFTDIRGNIKFIRGDVHLDFLDKLNFLMETNGLNKNTLSKACDIPYTTIDGWYKKGYEGLRLGTLRKLANYFGTTLDFWIEDEKKNPPSFPMMSFGKYLIPTRLKKP